MENIQALHDNKVAELEKIKEELKAVEAQIAELRKQHDAKMTVGIELQGAIKSLRELMALNSVKVETVA